MKYTQVKNDLLDSDNPIYTILSSNDAPIWWHNIKNDDSLYIEIRKENYLNVYHRGGCVARIKYHTRRKQFEILTHPKYLGQFDKSNAQWYKRKIKKGKIEYEAIYQDSVDWLSSKEKLDKLKDNVVKIYSGDNDGEATSEKFIQGKLIINHRNKYIDSEFAYRMFDGKRNTIRIDLVKIENGKFVFEELKRINDGRLRTIKNDPEISDQMLKYEEFIQQNQEALTHYYRTLYKVKKRLSLPIPSIKDIDSVSVDPNPTLLIFNNYETEGGKRANRISSMEEIFKEKNINYTIISENL